MKTNARNKDGLRKGTHKKCMVCKNVEPMHNWLFNPVGGMYACIHCGSSFYDPNMLKMTVVCNHIGGMNTESSFADMLAVFEETAAKLKISVNPDVKKYFNLHYDGSHATEKVIHDGETDFVWPFTINTVTLRCYGKDRAITVVDTATGIEYALNGTAKVDGKYEAIDTIWREVGGKKVPLTDVIAHIAKDYGE